MRKFLKEYFSKCIFIKKGMKIYGPSKRRYVCNNNFLFRIVFWDRTNIETRQVEVYRQLGNTTYLLSGIEEGEKVISKNGMLVYDALND